MDVKNIKRAATALGILAIIGTWAAGNYNMEKQATWTKAYQKKTIVESQTTDPNKTADVTTPIIQPLNLGDNTGEHEGDDHPSKNHKGD